MKKRIFVALTIVFAGACAFLFSIFYNEAKNTAITELNEEQTIQARQAARGIEEFFATWTRVLDALSKMDEIIDTDAVGKRYINLVYEANQEQIRSITRMDERGVILYDFPSTASAGTDIPDREHVRELLRDHKPVISDVFRAVQGFDAIALHVPVFSGSAFRGSIGILISFESLAKRYLDVIKIDKTGYAWVVSRDGTQIYSPIPGFTGKSVFETMKDSPSLIAMVNDMLKGHGGAATYTLNGTGGRKDGQVTEYAVYMPVHIGDTYWSIAVASSEQDVLSGLVPFKSKLVVVIGGIFICGMLLSLLGARAWFIVTEEEKRKRMERKLQLSEQSAEKFSTLFHAAPFAMALATMPDGVLYDVNRAWLDLSGYTGKEEVIGKSGAELEIIHKAEPRERMLNELRQFGSVRNAEMAACTRTGAPLTLLVNMDSIDIGGRKFILSSMQDVTERKQAMTALLESRAKLEAALASMTDAVSISDANGRFIDFNDAFATFHRFRSKDECSRTFAEYPDILDVFTADGEPALPDQWAVPRALRGETATNAEYGLRRKDTGESWVGSYSFGPIRDKDGLIVGAVVVGRDITEPKRADEILRTTVQRFHKILSNIFVGVLVVSEDNRIEFINQNLCDQFDIAEAPSDMIGITAKEMLAKVLPAYADPEANATYIRQVVSRRHRIEGEEVRMRNGRVLLRDHIPIMVDGKPRGRMWQHRDISERKVMEQELRESRDELELRVRERTAELDATIEKLELLNQELQEFAHVASHDLQEPLRKIQIFCDMTQRRCADTLDSAGREYLDRVQSSASRMRQLLDDLLQFSRAAATPEPFKTVDLEQIVREAADVFEETVREAGGLVEIGNLPTIEAEETQILRLFQNLIGNALKFRGTEPPRITVYAKQDDPGVCEIFVTDNGIGFEQQYAERIFKPFQRLHSRNEYEGTGIGLAICRKIAERHGGGIRAHSEPGKGSTFIVRLPVISGSDLHI